MKSILLITDNKYLYENISYLIKKLNLNDVVFEFVQSVSKHNNPDCNKIKMRSVNLKEEWKQEICSKDLVISVHCKQLFPKEMVESIRCINVHPGYNPYNRGWFPQVFSIINKLPIGVTIHEIDQEIDHGKIIVQERVPTYAWDTSTTLYKRILEKEIKMLEDYLPVIISGNYEAKLMEKEGNLNLKKEFDKLCKLNLDENLTMREAIDKLRALSHSGFNNAYFYDECENKIFVEINLMREIQK